MLEVKDLTKSYGSRKALDGVSFSAASGRITALVGPKGAGKTTTTQIVGGLLPADEGEVRLDGEKLTGGDRQNFGYLPAERGLYPEMRVADQIVYLARLHGLSLGASERNTDTLLERFGLTDRAYAPLRTLSGSEQQRAHIAAVLAHDPDVVVLDDPFRDLDLAAFGPVLDFLRDHAGSGVPVLLTTRDRALGERVADDVVLLDGGDVVSVERSGSDGTALRYEIGLTDDAGWLDSLDGVVVLEQLGNRAIVEVADREGGRRLLTEALQRGEVTRFAEASLTDIFREAV